MDLFIIFGIGAACSAVSEIFWKGRTRWSVTILGGAGMLLLRRILLRFSDTNRALLCLAGALLLFVLRMTLHILQRLYKSNDGRILIDLPSLSYGLYRFFLIAPAYAIIEYLENWFRT